MAKNNPQNERILSKYKDYLTADEKEALESDALVHPRYRNAKTNEVSYAPEFKENSMNMRSRDTSGGAGRGSVNPKTVSEMKKGGSVKGWGKARGARKAKMY